MNEKLNGMIEKLWRQDEIGLEKVVTRTKEEKMVDEHFSNTHHRERDGRFVVKIPIKPGLDRIGSSRSIVWRRFMYTEKKLGNLPEMKEFYVKEMRDLIAKGCLKEVNRPPVPGKFC